MSKPTCDCPERLIFDTNGQNPTQGEPICNGCPDFETCKLYKQHQWEHNHNKFVQSWNAAMGEPMGWKVFLVGIIIAASIAAAVTCASFTF